MPEFNPTPSRLDDLHAQAAALRAEIDELASPPHDLSADRLRDRLERAAEGLKRIERSIRYYEALERVDADITSGQAVIEALKADHSNRIQKAATVRAKIDTLTAETAADVESAMQIEKQHSDAYAAAIADGNDKAVRTLHDQITAAQRDTAAALDRAAKQRGVIDALNAQLAKFSAASDEIEAGLAGAKEQILKALLLKYRAAWDEKVGELVEVAAQLQKASDLAGVSVHHMLADLTLHQFAPDTATVTRASVRRRAESIALEEDDERAAGVAMAVKNARRD